MISRQKNIEQANRKPKGRPPKRYYALTLRINQNGIAEVWGMEKIAHNRPGYAINLAVRITKRETLTDHRVVFRDGYPSQWQEQDEAYATTPDRTAGIEGVFISRQLDKMRKQSR